MGVMLQPSIQRSSFHNGHGKLLVSESGQGHAVLRMQRQSVTMGGSASELWRLRMLLMLSAEVKVAGLGSTVSVLLMLGVLMLLPVVMEELSWRSCRAAGTPVSCRRASDSLCRASSVGGPTFAAG